MMQAMIFKDSAARWPKSQSGKIYTCFNASNVTNLSDLLAHHMQSGAKIRLMMTGVNVVESTCEKMVMQSPVPTARNHEEVGS